MANNFEVQVSPEAILLSAKNKAKKFLKGNRISPESFRNTYDNGLIDRDNEVVADLKRKFSESNSHQERVLKDESEVLEAIIGEQGELSEWLGCNVRLFNTCEFDDFVNKIDLVAEFQNEGITTAHAGLGVDVVMSSNPDRVGEKLEEIRMSIEKGEAGRVKYFDSPELGFKGELYQIPRMIIGADRDTVLALAALWVNRGGTKEKLGKHWIQFQILESLMMQAESLGAYALKVNQPQIAKRYELVSRLLTDIYNERSEINEDDGTRDGFFEILPSYLDRVLER